MKPANHIPENPFVSLNEQTIDISCRKKEYHLPLRHINKMYLRRKKSGYLSSFLGKMLAINDPEYDLFIKTQDGDIKLRINSLERYYFIQMIGVFRHLHHPN